MGENSQKQTKERPNNKLWIKILVPAVIVLIVAGIFIIKNASSFGKKGESEQINSEQAAEQVDDTGLLQGNDDIDFSSAEFALDATNNLDMDKILSYGLPVIIDFGADSCIPCKEMAPVLEELNEELRGKVIVKFVDVWENADVSQSVPIRVIPTQFFFDKNGKPYVPESPDAGFIMYEHQETGVHVFTAHEGGMTKDQILAVLKELGVE